MSRDDGAAAFAAIIALLGGVIAGSVAIANFTHSSWDLINDCEKDLPRNQNCKLIAVIDKGVKNEK